MNRTCLLENINLHVNNDLRVPSELLKAIYFRMKRRLSYFAFLLPWVLVFNGCSKIEPLPAVAQPVILRYEQKDTIVVGDTTINTGALKDYEQDSKVVFKFNVTSSSVLSKFFVNSTSDAISKLSRVLRTEPADAIDASGNFIKSLKNVVVYYAYHIDPLVPPLSSPMLKFSFQNELDYVGSSFVSFQVIKKGSSNGKRLTVIDISWQDTYSRGWGSQVGLGGLPIGAYYTAYAWVNARGPFLSLDYNTDIWRGEDVPLVADQIDMVGYVATQTRTTTTPAITSGWRYMVSPSDTVVLTETFANALVAQIGLSGGSTTGGPWQTDISVGGITRRATYATSTTVTATNFCSAANKAAYLAAGIALDNRSTPTGSASSTLYFRAISDAIPAFNYPTTVVPLLNSTSMLYGSDVYTGEPFAPRGGGNTLALRSAIRAAAKALAAMVPPKELKVVYFQRLDSIPNPANPLLRIAGPVSCAYADQLTHDNEFDVLLANVVTKGSTVSDRVRNVQVYGFVEFAKKADVATNNWYKRGLIRTSPMQTYTSSYSLPGSSDALVDVGQPGALLYCKILYQKK